MKVTGCAGEKTSSLKKTRTLVALVGDGPIEACQWDISNYFINQIIVMTVVNWAVYLRRKPIVCIALKTNCFRRNSILDPKPDSPANLDGGRWIVLFL